MTIILTRSHLYCALILLVGATLAAVAEGTGHTSILMVVGFLTGCFFTEVRCNRDEPTP